MNYYKIDYKNISFNRNFEDEFKTFRSEMTEDELKDYCLEEFHRYCGNHMEGHGKAQVNWSQTTRYSESHIAKLYSEINKQLVVYQQKVRDLIKKRGDLQEMLNIPFKTIRSGFFEIEADLMDEQILEQGWDKEQIKNRESKI